MGTPLTDVPLKLSRSTTLNMLVSFLMRQCFLDTERSARYTPLDGSRPTDISPSAKAKTVPLDGPAIMINLGFMSAASSSTQIGCNAVTKLHYCLTKTTYQTIPSLSASSHNISNLIAVLSGLFHSLLWCRLNLVLIDQPLSFRQPF